MPACSNKRLLLNNSDACSSSVATFDTLVYMLSVQ